MSATETEAPVSHAAGPTAVATDTLLKTPRRGAVKLLLLINVAATIWYFSWLLDPDRVGNPYLYGALLIAEVFNLIQAVGFWWTLAKDRVTQNLATPHYARVDVYVPRYDEPVAVVEPVIAAAVKLRGADVTVYLLDDGDDAEMAELARQYDVSYLTRDNNAGAKAGNINAALARTSGEYVLVLDCDHVPHPEFLRRTMGQLSDPRVAFVQTPQYYANADRNPVAAAAWAQQALFFGCIGRGKAALGAMFCCGTNVVLRRTALDDVGGFPEQSVTEDFQLSLLLQERGWRTSYVPEILVQGLGPQDLASYVSQQMRWARGCLSALGSAAAARLPLSVKLQYMLSSLYFLTGWTVLIYLALPLIRILTGEQPLAAATADSFLLHFAPYFLSAVCTVAIGGGGAYTFSAFAMAAASFWIHIVASLQVVMRRRAKFVVTPKSGAGLWQPLAVWPGLLVCAVLIAASAWGLSHSQDAAMLNNAAFAALHVCVIGTGMSWALRPPVLERSSRRGLPAGDARWHSVTSGPSGSSAEDPIPARPPAIRPSGRRQLRPIILWRPWDRILRSKRLVIVSVTLLMAGCALAFGIDSLFGRDTEAQARHACQRQAASMPASWRQHTEPSVASPDSALARAPMWTAPYQAAQAAAQEADAEGNPAKAARLRRIGNQPRALWFADASVGSNEVQTRVERLIQSAAEARKVPVLVTYAIPLRDCGGESAGGAASGQQYIDWVRAFAKGLGSGGVMSGPGAVVIIEPDALASLDRLPDERRAERLDLLRAATTLLAGIPRVSVYLDAGNGGWIAPEEMAKRLSDAGVSMARGFSLNVANFRKTIDEQRYGEEIAGRIDGKHFVVDTSRNGNGPPRAAEWCNPAERALGSAPRVAPERLVDAYLWIKPPGESDGSCRHGEPDAGVFWSEYANDLARAAGW
jgi:cellulose synthase (UDP-forming)